MGGNNETIVNLWCYHSCWQNLFQLNNNSSNKGSTPKDSLVVSDIDLNRVLDITLSTIERVDAQSANLSGDPNAGDKLFFILADELSNSYP